MSTEKFDIFFSGQIMEGQDDTEVRTRIGKMFKATPQQIEHLFSGNPVKVKSGVDLDSAVKYRVAFRDAGALVDIKPASSNAEATPRQPTSTTADESESSPDRPAQDAPPPAESEDITLLPPNTGSLIDCAPEVVPTPIPDISGIDVANVGTTIDESEPPPPADINTEGLVLNPANTGSLEDCQQPVEPLEIPDISALKIVDSEEKE